MTQLEEIKAQLAELTTKVESIKENEGEYTFTIKQLEKFITSIVDGFIEDVKSNIDNIHFSDEIVELELSYSREIEVSIDSAAIAGMVSDELSFDVHTIDINDYYDEVKA